MQYLWAFLIGGALCAIGQIIIDKTKIAPMRLLVTYVVAGVFLTLIGVYEPLVKFAGRGATVPLTGFGYALCEGVKKGVQRDGVIGIFTGGLTAAAAGISAAIIFGYLAGVIAKPREK